MTLTDILTVFNGSDGDATKALYARLVADFGPRSEIAVNLFRANKTSGRAKKYRGRFKGAGYDRKQWSLDNLCKLLPAHGADLGIAWGWGIDADAARSESPHQHVLYIELPAIGQVSFHTAARGTGPDYGKPWDRVRGESPQRVCRWIADLYKAKQ